MRIFSVAFANSVVETIGLEIINLNKVDKQKTLFNFAANQRLC